MRVTFRLRLVSLGRFLYGRFASVTFFLPSTRSRELNLVVIRVFKVYFPGL